MNEKELEEFVELLYPYILKKIKKDSSFKNVVKIKNATVVSTNGNKVSVKFPYDTTPFEALNETGEELAENDVVRIKYWIDLKNAVVESKVK